MRVAVLRRCYERATATDPTMRGRAGVEFTVGTSGRVADVEISTDTLRADVVACVRGTVSRFRFNEPPESDARYRVELSFVPQL